MLPSGNRVAAALLNGGLPTTALLPDCTEAARPSLWTPAPGAVVVLPERYTPTYAYPALIWLAEPGACETSVRTWLEEISTRNFVGIGLRPELYAARSSGRPAVTSAGLRPGLARFGSLLASLDHWVRLHPQRRYVAGARDAAHVAIGWLLSRPDWFAGGIAMDPPPVMHTAWRADSPLPAGCRLLWMSQTSADLTGGDDVQPMALRCLGIDVSLQASRSPEDVAGRAATINRWVLESIATAVST
jgi:hypothetical protein